MSEQGPSSRLKRRSDGEQASLMRWWRHTGEPVAITGLLMLLMAVPLLLVLEVVSARTALRSAALLLWLLGALLLTHLPLLLRSGSRRKIVLTGTGIAALVFTTLLGANTPLLAGSAAPTNPLAVAPAPSALTFRASPRISRQVFARILQRGAGNGPSPAAPLADELYEIIAGYGLDPAVALAFFAHESQLGTTGITSSANTYSWGGTRAAFKPQRAVDRVLVASKPFVRYASWQDGLRDWCELILNRYVAKGLDTVEKAVPIYAPSTDNNVPSAYIASVRRMVAVWQGRDPDPPQDDSLRVYGNDLPSALMMETFLAAGLDYHPTWAFHRYALAEAQAGRSLGSPQGESRRITVGGQQYAIQAFSLDTLYTPLADVESQTNWNDVRRMGDLLKQAKMP